MTSFANGISRRALLKDGVFSGLLVGVSLGLPGRGGALAQAIGPSGPSIPPDAFIRIAADNSVTIIIKHLEMGQGITTGLATIVADELDADWTDIRFEYAPANDALYKNLFLGFQITAGSTGIANSFDQMRRAGAAVRAMLVAAAARRWQVSASDITVERGVLRAGARRATFGEVAAAAAKLPPPADVVPKTPDRYVYIGKHVPRLDSAAKNSGAQRYVIDVRRPGQLTAVVARPPKFGARVKSFDASRARAVRGVSHVVAIPEGVAVVANGMWPALKGREALSVTWDEALAESRSSSDLVAEYTALLAKPGQVARRIGEPEKPLPAGTRVIEAVYAFPYLAHAAMEPINGVVQLRDGKVEIWSAPQSPTWDQDAVIEAIGVKREHITVHSLMAGGAFGHRSWPVPVVEGLHIARATALDVPICVQFTREDDVRGGDFRPLYVHGLKAALNDRGEIIHWQHRIVGQGIWASKPKTESFLDKDGLDRTSVQGGDDIPYAIPNVLVDLHSPKFNVPVGFWRSVGHSHTAFAMETMIDELAALAGRDPVAFRLAMLKDRPRDAQVLRLAAEKAGWGRPLPAGTARGVALHQFHRTPVALVVELRLDAGTVRVDRAVIAVDCGMAINPDIIRAQMEGGIGFGLSAALFGEVTMDQGVVVQSNFHDYPSLRIDGMPRVEVHIIENGPGPAGVAEAAVPPVAPAVANALAVLTGKRIRALPIGKADLSTT